MDSAHHKTNLLFLFLLFSTNLLTLFVSSVFYSSSCTPTFSATTVADTATFQVLPPEFLAFTQAQRLPFGFNHNFDSDTIYPPVGNGCTLFPNELRKFMSYRVNGSCPDDELLSQKLLLKGCEPLPRRRCRTAAPRNYSEPVPLPTSLWSTPSDSSVLWAAYTCKSYECLINRVKTQKGFDDCKDCFDLKGREQNRWISPRSNGLDFNIDNMLGTRKPGTIRIGLDIGGGVATFAVRMRGRNITIATKSMNLNGPFNSFMASRRVVPLYLSISWRLPFFDNTLDIVHSMHVLRNWIPTPLL